MGMLDYLSGDTTVQDDFQALRAVSTDNNQTGSVRLGVIYDFPGPDPLLLPLQSIPASVPEFLQPALQSASVFLFL